MAESRNLRIASPLGLGVAARLLWTAGIAAMLWLAVAWAMGCLP